MRRRTFGQYLVADPNICHGRLTFKGTRIFVEDVLEMVSDCIMILCVGKMEAAEYI